MQSPTLLQLEQGQMSGPLASDLQVGRDEGELPSDFSSMKSRGWILNF